MTTPTITISVKVNTIDGTETDHTYPIHSPQQGEQVIRDIIQQIPESLETLRTVFCLENPTTIYNPRNVTKITLDLQDTSAEHDTTQTELTQHVKEQLGLVKDRGKNNG